MAQIVVYVIYKKKAVWCADCMAGSYACSFAQTGMVVMCSKYVSWNILLLYSAYRRSDCFCSCRCARVVLKWKLLQQWKPYSDSQGTVGFFKERTASVGFMLNQMKQNNLESILVHYPATCVHILFSTGLPW